MKKTLITLFSLALIAGAATVHASPSGGKGLRGDSPRLSKLQQSLGLSDAQVDEIREIRANGGSRDDVRAVLDEEQRAMLDTRRARRQGLREDQPGRKSSSAGRGMHGQSPRMAHLQQALDLSDEQAAEIRDIRANGGTRDEIRAVLTDEQCATMDEHRANRQGHRNSKSGNRRPRDGRGVTDDTGEPVEPAAG
jgi:Spy/CpxP family protein refolding chaperone